jgi:hypothetical protein
MGEMNLVCAAWLNLTITQVSSRVVIVVLINVVAVITNSIAADQARADYHNVSRIAKPLVWEESSIVSVLNGKNFNHFGQSQWTA